MKKSKYSKGKKEALFSLRILDSKNKIYHVRNLKKWQTVYFLKKNYSKICPVFLHNRENSKKGRKCVIYSKGYLRNTHLGVMYEGFFTKPLRKFLKLFLNKF